MLPELPRLLLAVLIATWLAVNGRRKESLSPSGAVAGFIVGFISVASSVRFGLTLLVFYATSTRATRFKADLKKKIEDGYTSAGGNRSARQVFASSLPAVILSLTYVLLFRFDAPITTVFPLRSNLLLAYLLFFAACGGDTFSSEIGIALPGPGCQPILITFPWRRVPRGTNGGVTMAGTMASLLGGGIVGVTFYAFGPDKSISQSWLVGVGMFGGVVGSLLDSIIGAIFQASWLDRESGKVLKEAPERSEQHKYDHICGMELLSGESVNAISAILTTAFAPLLLNLFPTPF